MAHPDVSSEQAHVDHAYDRLESMRVAAASMLQDAFGEKGGTFQAVTERDIRVRTSLGRLEQLQIGDEALIFGRIDRDGDQFHIGRLAISDTDQEPLVVDWRAPVAEPFYRATGAQPMGLSLRRHFLTEGRRVLDLEDELFEGGEEGEGKSLGLSGSQVLISVLNRSRTGRMHDIVATVQREQDEIIRAPLAGIVVVQGGPGTGKTAVALHRAAYLLYTFRFPLETQGVLVVGPNPTFLGYIEHVLPSLGESGVELSTVSGLFGQVQVSGRERPAVRRLKGDPRMARLIARAVRNRQRPLRKTVTVPYGRGFLRITPELSQEIVSAARRRPGGHNARRRVVEQLLWRHLLNQLLSRKDRDRSGPTSFEVPGEDGRAEIIELVPVDDDLTPAELGRMLRRIPEVLDTLERMWPILTPQAFLHDLMGARPLLGLAGRGLLREDELDLLYRQREESVERVSWTAGDIPLLDEARALLGPLRRAGNGGAGGSSSGSGHGSNGPLASIEEIRSYGHVVVDEAQDLTPMQLRMLARRSLSGSMTIVGDIDQATGDWAPNSWDEVVRHLPRRSEWQLSQLTVNYRTPSEIMDLAARVLAVASPGSEAPDAVRATGRQPEMLEVSLSTRADTVAQVVDRVAAEEDPGTLGIIAPAPLLPGLATSLDDSDIEYGVAAKGALEFPVALLEIDDAKGLEFDTVVVVEPAAFVAASEHGLSGLYVALTRATRQLVVVHAEALPACLRTSTSSEDVLNWADRP